jgi:hypothetical protein
MSRGLDSCGDSTKAMNRYEPFFKWSSAIAAAFAILEGFDKLLSSKLGRVLFFAASLLVGGLLLWSEWRRKRNSSSIIVLHSSSSPAQPAPRLRGRLLQVLALTFLLLGSFGALGLLIASSRVNPSHLQGHLRYPKPGQCEFGEGKLRLIAREQRSEAWTGLCCLELEGAMDVPAGAPIRLHYGLSSNDYAEIKLEAGAFGAVDDIGWFWQGPLESGRHDVQRALQVQPDGPLLDRPLRASRVCIALLHEGSNNELTLDRLNW